MLIRDGKEYRNLEEQVRKNQEDIKYILEEQGVLNEFGIKVVGQITDASQLPSQYTGEFGDTFAVGTTTPYTLYIWTRAFSGQTQPFWFNIGMFPLPSTVPGPQGETGPQGPTGQRGSIWATGNNLPAVANYLVNDKFLNTANGDVYTLQYNQSTNNKEWVRTGNIRGTQGIQGLTGATGAIGPQGETGPQGPQGPKGGIAEIAGVLTSTDQLPAPGSVIPSTAYIITQNGVNNLYIIVNDEWFNAGAFASIQGPQGLAGPTGPQGPAGVNGTNGTLITVGGEYVPTFNMDTKADASATNEAISGLNTAIDSADAQINTLSLHVTQNAANISQLQQFETESTPAINFAESERQKSKNLLGANLDKSHEGYGINFTINNDGSITVNGTATWNATFKMDTITLPAGTYYASIRDNNNNTLTNAKLQIHYDSVYKDIQNQSFSLTNTVPCTFEFYVPNGTTINNQTYYIQLEKGTHATEYQPYNGAIVHEKDIQKSELSATLLATFTPQELNTYFAVPFDSVVSASGNKISLDTATGRIKINDASVRFLKISWNFAMYGTYTPNIYGRIRGSISGDYGSYARNNVSIDGNFNLGYPPRIIEVQNGEDVWLEFYTNTEGVNLNANQTYITVEVVE